MRGDHLKCDGASSIGAWTWLRANHIRAVTITPPSQTQLMRIRTQKSTNMLSIVTCLLFIVSIYNLIIPKSLVNLFKRWSIKCVIFVQETDWLLNARYIRPRPNWRVSRTRRDNSVITGLEGGRRQKGLQTMTNLPDMCQNYPLAWQLHVLSLTRSQNRVLVQCSNHKTLYIDTFDHLSLVDEKMYCMKVSAKLESGWRLLGYNCH